MKIGKKLTLLGFVSEITFETKDKDQFIARFPTKKNWSPKARRGTTVLASSTNGRSIFLIPWKCKRVLKDPIISKKESALYEKWSGYDVDTAFKLQVSKKSENLFRFGKILKIEYTSDKWDREGDRPEKFNLYRHVYRKPPKLFTDKSNDPTTWAIVGDGRNLVSVRGLIG